MPVPGESKRASYPDMREASVALWRQWLELYQDRFDAFYYNVRVGAGTRPRDDTRGDMRRDWWATTSLRIDVVAQRSGETWCIEVAERPTTKMLGSLQLYAHLLPQYQGPNPPKLDVIRDRCAEDFLIPTPIQARVVAALICRFLGADMRAVVEQAGILVFQFPGAGYPKLPPQFLPRTQSALWVPP